MDAHEQKVRDYWEFVAVHEHRGCYRVLYGSPMNPHGGNVGSSSPETPWKCAYDRTLEHEAKVTVALAAVGELASLRDRWGEVPQWVFLNNLATAELGRLKIGVKG